MKNNILYIPLTDPILDTINNWSASTTSIQVVFTVIGNICILCYRKAFIFSFYPCIIKLTHISDHMYSFHDYSTFSDIIKAKNISQDKI